MHFVLLGLVPDKYIGSVHWFLKIYWGFLVLPKLDCFSGFDIL